MKDSIIDTVCTRCWGALKDPKQEGLCVRCQGSGNEPDTFSWPVLVTMLVITVVSLYLIWSIK